MTSSMRPDPNRLAGGQGDRCPERRPAPNFGVIAGAPRDLVERRKAIAASTAQDTSAALNALHNPTEHIEHHALLLQLLHALLLRLLFLAGFFLVRANG